MTKNKKTKVLVLLKGSTLKKVFAEVISNQTLKIQAVKIPDSDSILLEDKNGYRYTRTTYPIEDYLYFEMI